MKIVNPFRRRKNVTASPGAMEVIRTGEVTQLVPLFPNYVVVGEYGRIYADQAAVRTVVDFIANNIADLSLRALVRTGREVRLVPRHAALDALNRPNDWMSSHDFIRGTVADMCVYDNAYWWVQFVGGAVAVLLILPTNVRVTGNPLFGPTKYEVWDGTTWLPVEPGAMVHFRGHNPADRRLGVSKLRALAQPLRDDQEISSSRRRMWANASRVQGVIERPADAPDWSEDARKRFRTDWQSTYAGADNSAKAAILEEGMTFRDVRFQPYEEEYIVGRRLLLEEACYTYGINPGLITGEVNYASMTAAHRHLYQDTLGYWIDMLQDRIEQDFVPLFAGDPRVRIEFNLDDKLSGSFEEQASVMSTLVGAPVLLRDEGRARLGYEPLPGGEGDGIVTPLNVLIGGQASPQTPTEVPTEEPVKAVGAKAAAQEETRVQLEFLKRGRANFEDACTQVLVRNFERQRSAGITANNVDRWNRELAYDLLGIAVETSKFFGEDAAKRIGGEYDTGRTVAYLTKGAEITAEITNRDTLDTLASGKDRKDVFDDAVNNRARQIAKSRTTMAMNFGIIEAGKQNDPEHKSAAAAPKAEPAPERDDDAQRKAALAPAPVPVAAETNGNGNGHTTAPVHVWVAAPEWPAWATARTESVAPQHNDITVNVDPPNVEIWNQPAEPSHVNVEVPVTPAPVNVESPVVHVTPAPVVVEAPVTNIDIPAAPAPEVHVEVPVNPAPITVETPQVNVEVPAPEVHVNVEPGDVHVAAPEAPQVNVEVPVEAPQITVEAAAPAPAPDVHVAAPEITVEAPNVHVTTPPVKVEVAPAEVHIDPPDVNIEVAAPEVNVQPPDVLVNPQYTLEQKTLPERTIKQVIRGEDGRISHIVDQNGRRLRVERDPETGEATAVLPDDTEE